MRRSAVCWSAAAVLAVGVISSASARPQYLAAFKAHYNTANGKPTLNAANCGLCHIGPANQAKWNAYGEALRKVVGDAKNVQDREKIVAALKAVEGERAPGSRQTYLERINADRVLVTANAPGNPGDSGGNPPNARVFPAGTPENLRTALLQPQWKELFNGASMDGLQKMNQGNWTVENGILKYTGGGNGWIRSADKYTNYSMIVVWRYPNAGNADSGIFLKAASDAGNPWPNSPQLNMGPQDNMVSLTNQPKRPDLVRPAGSGEWNVFEITVYNGLATVAVNGTPAWNAPANNIGTAAGYVGIENEGFPIEISRWSIVELP